MPLTNYIKDYMLDQIPDTFWVQLHTGDPGTAGTNNVSTITAGRATGSFTAASSGVISNSGNISWTNISITPATEDISHFSIWSLNTGGNCYGYNTVAVTRTVADGDTITANTGSITITLT